MGPPELLSDRYELIDVIGCGGMAIVWRGNDVRLDRHVAIKILRADHAHDSSFVERFWQEAQNSAALNHPRIVSVFDTGETSEAQGGLPYIVMELVQGGTLREKLVQQGPPATELAVTITADVCAALDFSHRHGLVHCDVKPSNVMLDRDGTAKLMDFGIARAVDETRTANTRPGAVLGTTHYLSPEHLRGRHVDGRSDVYAAGCLLYELLTGSPPFVGDDAASICLQHLREDPRPPSLLNPTVGTELDAVTLKALTKGLDNRYQTAAEMRFDLLRILRHRRPLAPRILTTDSSRGPEHADIPAVDRTNRRRVRLGRRRSSVPLLLTIAAVAGLALLWQFDRLGGEAVRPIPRVAGLPFLRAESTLHDAGFQRIERRTVRCWAQAHDEQPTCDRDQNGRALGTAPRAGTKASTSTVIALDIGKGPKTFRMPDLSGMPEALAKKVLARTDLLLTPTIRRIASDDPARGGTVATQHPAAGNSVAQGDAVVLTVYRDPKLVRVADYTGEPEAIARAGLEGAGFEVISDVVRSSRSAGIVVAQEPDSGQAVAGSRVVIHVSDGSHAMMKMPDVIGMTEADARTAIFRAGHLGEVLVDHAGLDETGSRSGNVVVGSDPEAAARMRRTDDIVLFAVGDGGPSSTSEDPPTTTSYAPPPATGPRRPPKPRSQASNTIPRTRVFFPSATDLVGSAR